MLKILRIKGTNDYFKSDGTLTQEVEGAISFDDFSSAHRFCRKLGLKNVELVLRTGPRHKEIVLSMTAAPERNKNKKSTGGEPGE